MDESFPQRIRARGTDDREDLGPASREPRETRSRSRRPIAVVLGLLALVSTRAGIAQDPTPRLARSEPLAALTEGDLPERLRAIQRAPELDAAPLALPVLAPIAAGDDPILAPAAASASWRIARSLDLDALMADELDLTPLRDARAGYLALANDESARPDLRQLAAFVADALAQLDAPAVLPIAE